ncbi:MAG: transcriptional repressor [Phycisphaerae bacterium]|nr:transcriptional repressor [Phycisphaerae bacterium]
MQRTTGSPAPASAADGRGARRSSRQREAIAELFAQPGRHLTADMVYDRVRRRLGNISLATVYRNLDRLCSEGRLRKLPLCGTQSWYDGGVHPHAHVRCIACGAIADVTAKEFTRLDAAANAASDYDVAGHELQFYGLCPACDGTQRSANETRGAARSAGGAQNQDGRD